MCMREREKTEEGGRLVPPQQKNSLSPSGRLYRVPRPLFYIRFFYMNFDRIFSALRPSYRDELKTHSRHVLGAHVGPKPPKNIWFKGGLKLF